MACVSMRPKASSIDHEQWSVAVSPVGYECACVSEMENDGMGGDGRGWEGTGWNVWGGVGWSVVAAVTKTFFFHSTLVQIASRDRRIMCITIAFETL